MHAAIGRLGSSILATLFVTAIASGCARNPRAGDQGEHETAGTVRIALATTTNMTTYRLRHATFQLVGPASLTLSSEEDVDAEFVSASVTAGGYELTLEDGWILERGTGTGYQAVDATLVSGAVQTVAIEAASATTVRFQFRVNGTSLGDGVLNIGIDIDDPTLDAGSGADGGCGAPDASGCTTCEAGTLLCGDQCADSCMGTLRIRAFIDGRSQLFVRGSNVWWSHFDYAAPGWHGEPTGLPTELWSQVASGTENHVVWCPSWPTPCNTCEGTCGDLRMQIESLPFEMLAPPLPSVGGAWELSVTLLEARGAVNIVQQPGASNDS